jgi:hypothetical protein
VASALATTTAALAASKLGSAGTLWGAAVTSVVSTTGVVFYKYYLDRGRHTLIPGLEDQAGVPQSDPPRQPYGARPLGADPDAEKTMVFPIVGDDDDPFTSPSEKTLAYGSLVRGLPETRAMPVLHDGSTRAMRTIPDQQPKRPMPHWYVFAAAAVVVFALVMGEITVAEKIMGNSIAATVNNEQDSGTTFGGGQTQKKKNDDRQPVTPSHSTTPTPTRSTSSPMPAPSSTGPTPAATTGAPTLAPSGQAASPKVPRRTPK